ncbi:alanine:cation symporter family protein [Morganella morganii]|uniref:alanine:cation symporter family protein n=1 Tax=Morganella morganii TaxID=582 RepID=UPI003CF13D27
MYFTCEKAVNFFFGDTRANKIAKNLYRVYYLAPIVLFTNLQADILWALTDILSAVYVLITMTLILSRRKEIFRLFNDFWDRYIPAKNAGQDVPAGDLL